MAKTFNSFLIKILVIENSPEPHSQVFLNSFNSFLIKILVIRLRLKAKEVADDATFNSFLIKILVIEIGRPIVDDVKAQLGFQFFFNQDFGHRSRSRFKSVWRAFSFNSFLIKILVIARVAARGGTWMETLSILF